MSGVLACTALAALQMSDPSGSQTRAVAVIYEVAGTAMTIPGEGGDARRARLFDWLRDGSTIRVKEGSRVGLAFTTGARFELFGIATAELKVDGFSEVEGRVEERSSVPPLPRPAAIGSERLADTRLGGVVLRGSSPTWIYPRRGASTIARETTLRFGGALAPDGYRIVLEDESGAVLLHTVTREQEVKLEANLLREGRAYFWRVLALGKAGILGTAEGEFTTLDAEAASHRIRLQEELAPSRSSHDLTLLAAGDVRLGLFWEALDEVRQAQHLSPDDGSIREAREVLEALVRSDVP